MKTLIQMTSSAIQSSGLTTMRMGRLSKSTLIKVPLISARQLSPPGRTFRNGTTSISMRIPSVVIRSDQVPGLNSAASPFKTMVEPINATALDLLCESLTRKACKTASPFSAQSPSQKKTGGESPYLASKFLYALIRACEVPLFVEHELTATRSKSNMLNAAFI